MYRPLQKKYCALRLPRPAEGDEVKPVTRIPSASLFTLNSVEASSRPRSVYTQESSRPSPGEKNSSLPSFMKRTDTSGCPSAQRSAVATQADASLLSDLRNFSRAGVLKNISRTVIVVPSGQPQGSMSCMSPASSVTRVPSALPRRRVVSSILDTADIAASASPRKPIVLMASSPRSSCSFEVAWRRKATPASSGAMPQPSSVTRMYVAPPPRISTVTLCAPASKEFSISSFITEAGLSTTSPAAIISATCGDKTFITGIYAAPFAPVSTGGGSSFRAFIALFQEKILYLKLVEKSITIMLKYMLIAID